MKYWKRRLGSLFVLLCTFICTLSTNPFSSGPVESTVFPTTPACPPSKDTTNTMAGDDAKTTVPTKKTCVCLIGSGNWGSAIATIVGRNCAALEECETQVNMWVYEEMVTITSDDDGATQRQEKLSTIINQRHENVKYLPGIGLPDNVVAVPDLATACRYATLLIFVLPHQFLPKLLPVIRQHVHPTECRRGISLIKGLGTHV